MARGRRNAVSQPSGGWDGTAQDDTAADGWCGAAQDDNAADGWGASAGDAGGWGAGTSDAADAWGTGGTQTNDLDWGAPATATIGGFDDQAASAPPAEPTKKSEKKSKSIGGLILGL